MSKNIKITLRPSIPEDESFVNELTRMSMKPYVEATWQDQADRDNYYEINTFNQANTRIVCIGDQRVGRVSLKYKDGEIFIDNMHIVPEMQGQGIGMQILQEIIEESRSKELACAVTVLKVNPARRLYERAGFVVCGEINHRFLMRLASN